MALILALESDHQQATLLGSLIRNKVQAELHIVDSRDAAIAAISARVPDVLLLSSLLSPRDEEDLLKHLRLVEGTEHVQTHNIPMMAAIGRDEQTGSTGFFGRFRRKPKEQEVFAACDPAVYAEEIRSYVVRAEEARIEAAARAHALVPLNAQPPAVHTPHAPVDAFTWKPRREETDASAPPAHAAHMAAADRLDQLRHEAREAERERLRHEIERERLREEETRERERERQRLDADEARRRAEDEHKRRDEDAAAAREAEAAAERAREQERQRADEERRRLETEAAAERERVLRAAEAAAQREIEEARKQFEEQQRRLREEEATERERLLREAALAAERAAVTERERLQAERKRLQEEMRLRQAEEAAERAQLKREAEEAIERARVAERLRHEQEQLRLQAEQTAERERLMREAEEAGERARQSERERLEQDRRRLEAEQTAQREQLVREAEAAAERARQAEQERERAEQRRIAAEAAAARGREEAEQRLAAQQAAEREREAAELRRIAAEQAVEQQREAAELLRIAAEQAAETEWALRLAKSERALREKEEAAAIERRPKRQPERKGKTPRKQEQPPVQPEMLPAVTASAGSVPATAAGKGRPAPQVSDEPFADFRAVVSGTSIDSIFKLMPITSWARPERPRPVETTDEQEEALALLARLKLPVPVSGFVYATGCRIRRVRVPSIADQHAGSVSGPVIVSRRALEELRTPR